jgi:hypothetical protein
MNVYKVEKYYRGGCTIVHYTSYLEDTEDFRDEVNEWAENEDGGQESGYNLSWNYEGQCDDKKYKPNVFYTEIKLLP